MCRGDGSETADESFAAGEIPTRDGCDLRFMLRNLGSCARSGFPTA